MKGATAQVPDGQPPAPRRASNALEWKQDEPAAVKLLDGSEVEIAGRIREVSGTKVRMFLARPVPAGAAVRVDLESRLWLAEVLVCLECKEGHEVWLQVRHVLASPPVATVRWADEEEALGMRAAGVRAWTDVLCRLVRALRCQALRGEAEDDRKFDEVMRTLEVKLREAGGPEEALGVVETAIKRSEQHNRQATECVERQHAEMDQLLQRMLAILGELAQQGPPPPTVSRISILVDTIHRIQALARRLSPPEADRVVLR